MEKKTQMTREARIKREVNRLKRLLAAVPKDKLKLVEGLIQRAAFLRVELEDLEEDINAKGSTEVYQASETSPPITRIRAAAQHYDKMVRQYLATCKQLADLAETSGAGKGDKDDEGEKNPFEELVQRRFRRVK